MGGKKSGAAILAAAMLVGSGMIVSADEAGAAMSGPLQEAISELEAGYSESYDIANTDITLCSGQEAEGNIEKIYLLEMRAILKAESVEQIPYFQGIMDSLSHQLGEGAVVPTELDIYRQLEENIGKEQEFAFYVKESYPAGMESDSVILFENGVEYVPLEEVLPLSREESYRRGYASMENAADGKVADGKAAAVSDAPGSNTADVIISTAVQFQAKFAETAAKR